MQVRARGVARTPNVRYVLSLCHSLPGSHMVPAIVGIYRVVPVAVINADIVAKSAVPAGELHKAPGRGQNRRTPSGPNIYAQMVCGANAAGGLSRPEPRSHKVAVRRRPEEAGRSDAH